MPHQITVSDLLDALQERLRLRLLAGEKGLGNIIFNARIEKSDLIIAGPLNYIHPSPIQIIGPKEKQYLNNLSKTDQYAALQRLFTAEPAAILLSNRLKSIPALEEMAEQHNTPLLASSLQDAQVLDNLQYYAARFFARKTNLHGVFLEVLGMGVLLTGHSAVGKSELALELIIRGHRLIADDVTEFRRIAPDIVSGSCPPLLREFLEVRGLGILNIPAMFGDSATKHSKYLHLIVHLKRMKLQEIAGMERLRGATRYRNVLGVDIPEITVPVAPGRNLAILVETAVRNYILKLKGYDAAEIFIQRQQQAIEDNS
ncbi:MAG TPA: HPr(Ser) kinase/phosphatase [Thiolapillus brandeum]|uniref:HPr kinase/phosphorylase n=1 Tax=Thiolapillus brandeum TaxID=1076588 RepID=A0A831K288_9GAMM|nr:HPr(Ser) kinase/phosphatase [Thiolapillus brandeum]